MSIIIKGMEMPKENEILVFDMWHGKIYARSITNIGSKFYEVVPLPKGHGRLIDGDALFEKMYRLSDNEGEHKDSRVDDALILRDSACYLIEDAPTIVPAEGGTDECSEN